ncbi:MAG: hypothetical protein VB858_11840, partial [Planctomycetaceae bacterium]
MKTIFSTVALTVICLVPSVYAADSVRLELAVHNLARVARRASMDSILIIVREDARSTRGVDSQQIQAALEGQLKRMIRRESGITSQIGGKTVQQAAKTRARRNIQPSEAAAILRDTTADGVMNADFRELNGRFTVRLSLVDPQQTRFNTTVTLEFRPQADVEKPQKTLPQVISGPARTTTGTVDPARRAQSSSGYIVTRTDGIPGTARTRGRAGSGGAGSGRLPVKRFDSKGPLKQASSPDSRQSKRDRQHERSASQTDPDVPKSSTHSIPEKSGNTVRPAPIPSSPVARNVLRFASSQIGKQVGNGQCWTLAAEALKAAGARPAQGYTYGDEIPLQDIQPGDILQFTRARFDEPGYWAVMGAPNHTAVVYSL